MNCLLSHSVPCGTTVWHTKKQQQGQPPSVGHDTRSVEISQSCCLEGRVWHVHLSLLPSTASAAQLLPAPLAEATSKVKEAQPQAPWIPSMAAFDFQNKR